MGRRSTKWFRALAMVPWLPFRLFRNGEAGAWYDPSDMSTLFQDSAGTTPVTAVGQPVGLALDKRLGLVRGPELITNGGFDSATNWTVGAEWSIASGVATKTAGLESGLDQTIALAPNTYYEVTLTVTVSAGGITPALKGGTQVTGPAFTTSGTYRFFIANNGTANTFISFISNSSFAGTIDNVSVKAVPGNHASQATTAAKPTLVARKNLLTKTEQLSDATWTKTGVSVAATGITSPYVLTELREDTSLGMHKIVATPGAANIPSTLSFVIKPNGRTKVYVGQYDGAAQYELVDLVAGTITSNQAAYSNRVVTPLGDGSCRISFTSTSGWGYFVIALSDGTSSTYTGDGVSGVLVGGFQRENGAVLTRYQRVNTATDYDPVGFPHYFALDRVADHVTAAAGGGTTGICVCAAIRAGGAGNARTIWSDRGTNTGYRLSINASNQLVLSAGNGSAHTEVVGPTVTAGTDYVVTGWHDGTNLNVQLNAGAATSAAFGTATAGTAGFTIGMDNGEATGYYGERIYEIVYRKDDASTAGERTSLITYMAAQAGITL